MSSINFPFLPTAKEVLIKPEEFFDKRIRSIQRWQQPIMYLLFLIFIGAFFTSNQAKLFFKEFTFIITEKFGLEDMFVGFEPSMFGIALLFLLLIIVLLLATSFKYWVAHWYIKMWNKEAAFQNTYAVLTYGGTPGWLAMPFSALFFTILYKSIGSGNPVNWLLTSLSFVVWIALEGYSIYLRVYALAKVQSITKWQVILSVYVLGLLTYLVGLLIIEFVILSLVFLLLALFGLI